MIGILKMYIVRKRQLTTVLC